MQESLKERQKGMLLFAIAEVEAKQRDLDVRDDVERLVLGEEREPDGKRILAAERAVSRPDLSTVCQQAGLNSESEEDIPVSGSPASRRRGRCQTAPSRACSASSCSSRTPSILLRPSPPSLRAWELLCVELSASREAKFDEALEGVQAVVRAPRVSWTSRKQCKSRSKPTNRRAKPSLRESVSGRRESPKVDSEADGIAPCES